MSLTECHICNYINCRPSHKPGVGREGREPDSPTNPVLEFSASIAKCPAKNYYEGQRAARNFFSFLWNQSEIVAEAQRRIESPLDLS